MFLCCVLLASMLHGFWSEAFEEEAFEEIAVGIVRDSRAPDQARRQSLDLLFTHADPVADVLVREAIAAVSQGSTDHALTGCLALALRRAAGRYWSAIMPLMAESDDICRSILESVHGLGSLWPQPKDLADLGPTGWGEVYRLYRRVRPAAVAREDGGARVRSLNDFGERVPHVIAGFGTQEAIATLDALAREFPDDADIFRWHALEARRKRHLTEWQPPEPAAVVTLLDHPGARLVRSDEELREAVLLALERIQKRLQGATPEVRAFWNEPEGQDRSRGWRHKDENFLSDLLRNRLEEELRRVGAIANREVEIRASRSAPIGQRTDILVEAVVRPPGPAEAVIAHVIVEVKGCWNRDLFTAMETQLRDRYLRDSGWRQGIYLVGWFVCERWDDANIAGKKPTLDDTLERLKQRLQTQATGLSSDQATLRAVVLDLSIR